MNGTASGRVGEWLMSIKGVVVALTALLVVVPALINSAHDVYNAVVRNPTNVYARTNDELFRKHFKDKPVLSQPLAIKTATQTAEMLLEVYENGDIFVKYGTFTQWFPVESLKAAGGPLVGDAAAQTLPSPQAGRFEVAGAERLTIDVPAIRREADERKAQEAQRRVETIDRTYVLAQTKDDHPSLFSASSRVYTATFRAERGYRIIRHTVQISSASQFELRSADLTQDGSELRVTYSLASGPAMDRWRGWVKGTVQTVQQRAD
jgi:hypothetical protein